MNVDHIFNAGPSSDIVPQGNIARQAVDPLRGYAYQTFAAAIAWMDIGENDQLFLEVAEDYAVMVKQALEAVQVKDTEKSGSVTLNNKNIRDAVASFVDLVGRNPGIRVDLRYFTVSDIGKERKKADRPAGIAGLEYWRRVAMGADLTPLRKILERDKFPESVREFCKARNDVELRHDLIERIHWDCGKPDFSMLRQALEDRLVVMCRDKFSLPASEAKRLVDPLILKVMEKSIADTPQERVLRRVDLYDAIDKSTQISVPRSTLDSIMQRMVSNTVVFPQGEQYSGSTISAGEASWFIDGAEIPVPRAMISRNDIESAVTQALVDFKACVLVGGSGLGKTHISQAVARLRDYSFVKVDFRGTDANESSRILRTVNAHIGELSSSLLILEDLNNLDDMHVAAIMGLVIEALRRRDRKVVITCYRQPSASILADAGLDQGCVVDCPYFTEEETQELVRVNGGDPKVWGHLAYMAGAGGHPQLTHAFVSGMAARKWPIEEIREIVSRGLSSDDIDVTCDTARRNLVSALPEESRNILYRISLLIGHFTRSQMLAVGAIPPPISRAGEFFDQVVGPWVDAIGKDSYQVSPLARNFGCEMLTIDEQTHIHEAIVDQMLIKREINTVDANSVLLHAIAGKSSQGLAILARSVMMAKDRTLEILAEHFIVLLFLRTDKMIFPEDPLVSVMLRLAQFKLAVAANECGKVSAIIKALLDEISAVTAGELRNTCEMTVLSIVLNTIGIANYLDNWVGILYRFKGIVESDDLMQNLRTNVENSKEMAGANFFSFLFAVGSTGISSVERLEYVINDLDKIDDSERAIWLTPSDIKFSDYFLFINNPWVLQQRGGTLNIADAILCYKRMAEKVQNWGIRPLTIQCWVAQAVLFDEYGNDMESALVVLDKAEVVLGSDQILDYARAKIFGHAGQHTKALAIMRGIADKISGDNFVGRAFALREAAISAAKCDEWSQAEKWFLEAQCAAELAKTEDMHVMAVGLGADAAVTEIQIGDVGKALTNLAKALEAVADINPDASLSAAYCHRIVRNAVLWTQSYVEGRNVKIEGEPIVMLPGTCSNLDPLPAIRDLPLGDIDLVWYMLAQTEIWACLDVGIAARLNDHLAQETIPVMEFELRKRVIQNDIKSLNAVKFSKNFIPYVEAAAYMIKEGDRLTSKFDSLSLERETIPALDISVPVDVVTEQSSISTIIAFVIHAALANRSETIGELKVALCNEFDGVFPGKGVFNYFEKGQSDTLNLLDKTVIDIVKALSQNKYLKPLELWMAGLRLFERIDQLSFRELLTSYLASWQRKEWKRITTTETFRLSMPFKTVPAINAVLKIVEDDRSFVAKLILVTSDAVGASFSLEYRNTLKNI